MGALSPDERTVVSRDFASGTATFIGGTTDTTEILLGVFVRAIPILSDVPSPLSDSVPAVNNYFH